MAHIAHWKEANINELEKIISEKPVIGLVNIKGIPGAQLQQMRQSLYGKAILRISKIKLLMIALEETESKKDGIRDLIHYLDGQVGLIATDMNPFKLFRVLESSKRPAPIKAGETSPKDIEIKAGETVFKPGPIVGELQRAGIPAAIEQGKVVIKSDKVVAKTGDVISPELATMLTRLQIYPLTVGLDLSAVFENGVIFKRKDLDIDPQQFIDKFKTGSSAAFNLAFYVNYPNQFTIMPLLQGAHAKAMNLMINANIITPSIINLQLSKGFSHMMAIGLKLAPEALGTELKERIGGIGETSTAAGVPVEETPETKKEDDSSGKKKPEEKKVTEEEAASGLSSLFG